MVTSGGRAHTGGQCVLLAACAAKMKSRLCPFLDHCARSGSLLRGVGSAVTVPQGPVEQGLGVCPWKQSKEATAPGNLRSDTHRR